MLISGDPKTVTLIYQTEQGLNGGQAINKDFALVCLLTVGPASPQTILQPFPTISNAWLEETQSAAGRVPTLVP